MNDAPARYLSNREARSVTQLGSQTMQRSSCIACTSWCVFIRVSVTAGSRCFFSEKGSKQGLIVCTESGGVKD